MKDRTIIAAATSSGRGGISVIRMSGNSSRLIAEKMCGELAESWKFKKCSIKSKEGRTIDSGMVVFFQSPNSYTGEDVVEFHCHGNPTIVNLIIDEALILGAVLAEPGEFTKTAFLNNKIDLAQAESVADLIGAQSESAVIAATSSLAGEFSSKVNILIDKIIKNRVVIEANIDFPEEEVEGVLLKGVGEGLVDALEEIEDLLVETKKGIKLREGYSVAIVGPPNAGKSSLLNVFARDDLAITSDIPGTTRDLVKAEVLVEGALIEFTDTAGLRDNPNDEVERKGMGRSLEVSQKSNLTLLVQDINEERDVKVDLGNFLKVKNKIDLNRSYKIQDDVFYISCSTGEGIVELLHAIGENLGIDGGIETVFSSRKRHEKSLISAKMFINESVSSLHEGLALELVAESLRSAHNELGNILRPMSSDDLLGEIFSEFCIGK